MNNLYIGQIYEAKNGTVREITRLSGNKISYSMRMKNGRYKLLHTTTNSFKANKKQHKWKLVSVDHFPKELFSI